MPFATTEQQAAWSRDYYQREKERVLGFKRSWAERNPEKRAAHTAVGNAVRDGRLERQPCERCGSKKVHAHHDDYSKPLEVRWLCPLHHSAVHYEASL